MAKQPTLQSEIDRLQADVDELKKTNGYERRDLISACPLFFTKSMRSEALQVMYRDLLCWLRLLNAVPITQPKCHSPFDIPRESTLGLAPDDLAAVFDVIKITFLSGKTETLHQLGQALNLADDRSNVDPVNAKPALNAPNIRRLEIEYLTRVTFPALFCHFVSHEFVEAAGQLLLVCLQTVGQTRIILELLETFILHAYRFIRTFRDQFLRKLTFVETDEPVLLVSSEMVRSALSEAFIAALPSLTAPHREVLRQACITDDRGIARWMGQFFSTVLRLWSASPVFAAFHTLRLDVVSRELGIAKLDPLRQLYGPIKVAVQKNARYAAPLELKKVIWESRIPFVLSRLDIKLLLDILDVNPNLGLPDVSELRHVVAKLPKIKGPKGVEGDWLQLREAALIYAAFEVDPTTDLLKGAFLGSRPRSDNPAGERPRAEPMLERQWEEIKQQAAVDGRSPHELLGGRELPLQKYGLEEVRRSLLQTKADKDALRDRLSAFSLLHLEEQEVRRSLREAAIVGAGARPGAESLADFGAGMQKEFRAHVVRICWEWTKIKPQAVEKRSGVLRGRFRRGFKQALESKLPDFKFPPSAADPFLLVTRSLKELLVTRLGIGQDVRVDDLERSLADAVVFFANYSFARTVAALNQNCQKFLPVPAVTVEHPEEPDTQEELPTRWALILGHDWNRPLLKCLTFYVNSFIARPDAVGTDKFGTSILAILGFWEFFHAYEKTLEGEAAVGATEFTNGHPIATCTLHYGIFVNETTREVDPSKWDARLNGLFVAVKRAENLINEFVKAKKLYIPADIIAAIQGLVSAFYKGHAQ
jgi:hypothetical protein